MARMLSRRHAVAVAAICVAIFTGSAQAAAAQDLKQQGGPVAMSVKDIATQLGVKVQPREDDELSVGSSFTATLEQPDKLSGFGIKGMHPGARVTVARTAPDKVRLEVDEMDPVPARGSTTVKVDAKGQLVPPARG